MNNTFKALCLSSLLALTGFITKPAMADEWNKKIEFQFSGPVEIPGHTLPAGKYVFHLAGSETDRNIVQVFSEDSAGNERLVATLLAIPNDLQETPDKPIVYFEERSAGSPEAIHSWYYPGDKAGWEFVYPRDQEGS